MNLCINPVVDDRDYEDTVRLRNIDNDFSPTTIEESRVFDSINPPDLVWERHLGRDKSGQARARGVIREERMPEGKMFFLDISLLEEDCVEDWREMKDVLEERIAVHGGTRFSGVTRCTREPIARAYEECGYTISQRNPMSFLDVTAFDPTPFRPSIATARDRGFEILGLPEYIDRVGDKWQHEYWRLTLDLFRDVPMPMPFVEWPFEEMKLYMDSPAWKNDTRFLALQGETLAALSEYSIRPADERLAATYLTGCRREFRRNGLATALKTMALESAKARGVEKIYTDNEENNPMYTLNVALGFRKAWDWLFYVKEAS